jgi:hypothetical protein
MKRRQFMGFIAATPLVMTVTRRARAADKSLDGIRKNWKSLLALNASTAL